MITRKLNFTVLESGIAPVTRVLKSRFKDLTDEELKEIQSIKVVRDKPDKEDYAYDTKTELGVLRIAMSQSENLVMDIKRELDKEQKEKPDERIYDLEEIPQDKKTEPDESADSLTLEGEKSQVSLGFVSDILDRAYNRRTTLTSWILYFMFGLKDDNFGPISKTLKSSEFARAYTEYTNRAKTSKSEADNYLKTAFEKKEGDEVSPEEKQKLVRRASFLIDTYNKLNISFVKTFPKVFCIQNIAMPFLKMLLPKVKLFDFMVTINPWLYDLVSENLGNYVGEIGEIQDNSAKKETDEKVISEIRLTSLSHKEFSVQKIMKNIHDGLDRVFGKNSTVSSMILNKLLEKKLKYDGFKSFAKEFLEGTEGKDFIKRLCGGLSQSAENPESQFNINGDKKEKEKYWGAAVISRMIRFARTVTPKWVTEYSNIFGMVFVPLNLTMPLIAKVFHKGFLGFITHTLLKVFPIANELLFDHFANFRQEILDIQNEINSDKSKSLSNLFPPIEGRSTCEAFTSGLKRVWSSIKGFAASKLYGKPATV